MGRRITGGSGRAALAVTLGILASSAGAARAAQLTYTLASPLVKASCAGDADGDCLDDTEENNLAWIVAPKIFYDEDEDCAPANNAVHYDRKDFYQVRPGGLTWSSAGLPVATPINKWPSASGSKTLSITYFFLYPHDCNGNLYAGHQGDGEKVVFHLSSTDLVRWSITGATYHAHGKANYFSGDYLATRAQEIGSLYASVAADEDGHGSWPGKSGGSSDCAGDEDDTTFGLRDCFVETMRKDNEKGRYEYAYDGEKNIGGPSPEQWNPNTVTVSGSMVWSTFDVGHGALVEYWSGVDRPFCGFQCAVRKSDGQCYLTNHNERDCTGTSLSSHPNKSGFFVW